MTINVTVTGGPNAIASGIFFGGSAQTAPSVTSVNGTTVTVAQQGNFTVTTSGYPAPSITEVGGLPSGLTFVDNGNGTATLSGTPAANSNSSYPLSLTAGNSGSNTTQNFTLMVNPAVVVTGPSATFVNSNVSTQGNWMGVYGGDGYLLANGSAPAIGNLSYGSYAISSEQNWMWAANTSDVRAPVTDTKGDRAAATWYSATKFSIDVNFTDGNTHQVALYAVDWDKQGRSERVDILDAPAGTLLDSRTIPGSNSGTGTSAMTNGVYLIWNISGHVIINIVRTSGPNAIISGVFFN